MTGPFGVKETSTRLTESTKIETDSGELVSHVIKTIQDLPLKTHSVDLVCLKITVKARDNLVKTLESEKKSPPSSQETVRPTTTRWTHLCDSEVPQDNLGVQSHDKNRRSRYFDPKVRVLNRTVRGSRFQDTLNEFRGKRDQQILSTCLSTFEDDTEVHVEMKYYFDPLFSDDVYKCFRVQENVSHEDSMKILDHVLTDVYRDMATVNEFVGQNDFVSLLPSKMLELLMRDSDSESE